MDGWARAIPSAPRPRIDAAGRLIVALDFPTVEEAGELVSELGPRVSFYKIGLHLQLARGLFDFARELQKQKKRIFLDFKYIDIGDTIEGVISSASAMGIEFVTVYQSPLAIEAALRVRRSDRPKILTVTLLTDRDERYIKEEYNLDLTVSEFVVKKAIMVERAGGDGVICSPNEVCAIRERIKRPDFLIVTPGIRPEWSLSGGHKRAGTPTHAVACGADYLVVGRPIIRAPDGKRSDAAVRIIDEMQEAFDNRG
jgi:orotidine-5'-phosphate decarboxylase